MLKRCTFLYHSAKVINQFSHLVFSMNPCIMLFACVLQELCKEAPEAPDTPQLLVDFWEALLVASSQEAVIQELLFRLTSVYIDRITRRQQPSARPLKTADDLVREAPEPQSSPTSPGPTPHPPHLDPHL